MANEHLHLHRTYNFIIIKYYVEVIYYAVKSSNYICTNIILFLGQDKNLIADLWITFSTFLIAFFM